MAIKKTIHLISIAAPFRFGQEDMRRPPSALLYVGGYLKKNGFPVKIHHINEQEIPQSIRDISRDDTTLFVGFSVITGAPVASSAHASRLLKEIQPDFPIVWGGIHSSILPRECLEYPFVDYIVIGEGEQTALELAQFLANQSYLAEDAIKGLAFKSNGKIVINAMRPFEKNLDRFKQDWSLVDIQDYIKGKTFYFITSRGCPHCCGFCYNLQYNHRRWRAHSVDFVVDELCAIQEKTGINRIVFDDDNFFTNVSRGLEIIKRLHEKEILCQWVEIRCDYITEDILAQLNRYRARRLFIGWESGNPQTLEKINKEITVALILEKFKLMSQYKNLRVDASAIIAFPWETSADIRKTIRLALKLFFLKPFKISFNLGQYIPYPGSSILDETFSRGFAFPVTPEGWREYDILTGTFINPWAGIKKVRKYYLVDKYAKMLYLPPVFSKKRYLLIILAVIRLFFGIYCFPVEIWREERIAKRKKRDDFSLRAATKIQG